MVWSMIRNSNIPTSLWAEAPKATIYILNHVPTKVILKTPFELFTGWKSSMKHMSVWGCPSEVRIYITHMRRNLSQGLVEAKLHGESRVIQRCFDDNKR